MDDDIFTISRMKTSTRQLSALSAKERVSCFEYFGLLQRGLYSMKKLAQAFLAPGGLGKTESTVTLTAVTLRKDSLVGRRDSTKVDKSDPGRRTGVDMFGILAQALNKNSIKVYRWMMLVILYSSANVIDYRCDDEKKTLELG
jgi:hypothetical protein